MADLFQEHRTAVLLVLSGLVALVLLIVFGQWFSRTRGWRRTLVHRGRQFAGGLGDLGRLAAGPYRYHRDVRAVARLLADPGLDEDPQAPFAVPDEFRAPDDPCAAVYCPVAIGLIPGMTDALAVLDLATLPGVGTIDGPPGPPGPARRLAAAIAAQLAAGMLAPTGVRLLVTDTVLPGFGGPPLSDALDLLDRTGPARPPGPVRARPIRPGHEDLSSQPEEDLPVVRTVLVCAATYPEEMAQVSDLAERLDDLRVIIMGRHPGSRWRLELDEYGRITAPELGLQANGTPLERGLGRALRQRERLRRRLAPPVAAVPGPIAPTDPDEPFPPGPDDDGGSRYDPAGRAAPDVSSDPGEPDDHLAGPDGLRGWAPTDPDELAEPEPAESHGRQAGAAGDGRSAAAAVSAGTSVAVTPGAVTPGAGKSGA
ncbi:hypothetical protein [Candidatus Frankia nodulisporulans]|uniref:hypothetical protein n=1 Tax=Candidatus Frankia nodulisporulans TaxID=2060052 RepID=UPI0015816419|nr:hypothetical protein [Candidatus Frankia nodulisporulans]